MSELMKRPPIEGNCKIVIFMSQDCKKSYHIHSSQMPSLMRFLERHSEEEGSIAWEDLAKNRLAKYKKAGLVLRGIRYRENLSQKQLAEMSGVSQNEISKIENGKRAVGQRVGKRLAKALKINYKLLLQE